MSGYPSQEHLQLIYGHDFVALRHSVGQCSVNLWPSPRKTWAGGGLTSYYVSTVVPQALDVDWANWEHDNSAGKILLKGVAKRTLLPCNYAIVSVNKDNG